MRAKRFVGEQVLVVQGNLPKDPRDFSRERNWQVF